MSPRKDGLSSCLRLALRVQGDALVAEGLHKAGPLLLSA